MKTMTVRKIYHFQQCKCFFCSHTSCTHLFYLPPCKNPHAKPVNRGVYTTNNNTSMVSVVSIVSPPILFFKRNSCLLPPSWQENLVNSFRKSLPKSNLSLNGISNNGVVWMNGMNTVICTSKKHATVIHLRMWPF